MKSPKIDNLVVGASGFIGKQLWKNLGKEQSRGTFCHHRPSGVGCHWIQLDLSNFDQVRNVVHQLSPAIIYHPAALASAETCQEQPEQCWNINVEGTRALVNAAKEVGTKVVYFSSDYVFDGLQGPYAETDTPSPINVYGKAKLAAEQIIQDVLDDFLIIRVNVVYGWEQRGKNFVMGLVNKLKQGSIVPVPNDQMGNPTYVNDISKIVIELVERRKIGVFHVAGSQHIDRYTFAVMVAKAFQLDSNLLIPVKTSELQQCAPRPLQAGLRSDRVKDLLGRALLGPEEGLKRMVEEGALLRTKEKSQVELK